MAFTKSRRQTLKAIVTTALAIKATRLSVGTAIAQDYPSKPVMLVIPYAVGGTTDIGGRLLGKQLEQHFDKPFVIENRPGASARIGASFVTRSTPDGYTLLYTVADPFSIIPHVFRNVPYDPLKDVTPITMIGSTPMGLVVSSKVPAKNVAELIKLAKDRPGSLTYGSWGIGSGGHVRTEAFASAAGVQLVHVPFQGSGPAFTALLGGHIDLMIVGVALAADNHKAGIVRMVAVDTKQRYPGLPDVPTFGEQGLPLDLAFWNGVLGPANMPTATVELLNSAINQVIQDPEFKRAADVAGLTVNEPGANGTGVSPSDVRAFYIAEYNRWGAIIRKANIVAE
jgi:tripartite-type tricarboxylate transporter receptor subunit TctC